MPSYPALAIFWAAVVLCAVAQVALLHSFFLGASRPGRDASRAFRATETLWVVLPAVALALLLAVTWRTLSPSSHGPAALSVSVADGAVRS